MDDIKAECVFNEQVHVKEEEDHIKEEPEWEDHAGPHGISAAAARAGLYANHEVKDELVLGPEGVQPADIAFTLYACQASAARAQPVLRDCVRQVADNADVGNQLHSNSNVHTEKEIYVCDICTKRFAMKTQLMEHVIIHIHQEPEQEEIRDADNMHVKEEAVEWLREEAAWEDSAAAGSAAALARLYAGHEVKDELVLGPEGLQPRDIAFTICAAQALAVKEQHELRDCVARLERIEDPAPLSIQQPHSRHGAGQEGNGLSARARGRHRDHTYARTECPPAVFAKAGASRGQRGGRGDTRGRGSTGAHGHCCPTCNNTFTTPSQLKRHELTHTGETPYSCGTCNKKFTMSSSLNTHERTHTGKRPFSCGICKQKFTLSSSLKKHERIHTGVRPFSCGICKQKFTQLGTLKRHERTHTGERPFSCGICKQKFTQSSSLKTHERTHTGERPFSCGICKQKFTQSSSLKTHERTHTGERPFSCGICKQKFSSSSYLKAHERAHTGERPFSCGICKQNFMQSSHLKAHERTHTGERPFSCGICKQKFTRSSDLKTHERIHTGVRPFSCGVCKQKFTRSSHLKTHERIHTGERPFSCGICKQKFTRSSHLKTHERIHTGVRSNQIKIKSNNLFVNNRSYT